MITRTVDRCIEAFTARSFRASIRAAAMRPIPIFIVGLPRAGSTLLEQILSSHSLVEGTSELPDIPCLARKLGHIPSDSRCSTPDARRELGEEYLKRASVQRRTDRPFFIDKLPNNWLFVPFIHLILPNAKIIDARRHPLACCFSNFRQHFARGQDFTYDFEILGSILFRLCAADGARRRGAPGPCAPSDLRAHGRRHRSRGSGTARLLRAGVRAAACLEFYRTERAVRTASSEQVRRPIYREATEEWRALRGVSRAAEGRPRAGARNLSGSARVFPATLTQQSTRRR